MKKIKRMLSFVVAICIVMTGLVIYTQPEVFAGDYVAVQISGGPSSVDRATTSTVSVTVVTTKNTSSDIVWSNRGSATCNNTNGSKTTVGETTNANQYTFSWNVSSWSNGSYTISASATVRHKTYSSITDTTTVTHTFTVTCSHTGYTSTVSTVSPTCTSGGYTNYKCTKCNATWTGNNTSARGHDFSNQTTTSTYLKSAATCTSAAVYYYKCSRCSTSSQNNGNTTYTYGSVDSTNHSWGAWSQTTAPTCTSAGVDTRVCSRNASHTETRTGAAATGHTWPGDWTVATPATCTSSGTKVKNCTVCGALLDSATIPASGHSFNTQSATSTYLRTAATCNAAATYWYKCDNCAESSEGDTNTYYSSGGFDSTNHDYDSVVTAPTCTVAGYTTHTCSRCGDTYTDTPVAALGHDYSSTSTDAEHIASAATCTAAATYYYSCSRCGANSGSTFTSGEPLGHDLDAGTVTTPATCTTAGERTYSCSRCDYTETAVIPATGHTWVAGATTAPTCTDQGYTSYTCSVCGATKQDDYVAALGGSHNFNTNTEQANNPSMDKSAAFFRAGPTCTECATYWFKCTRCGASSENYGGAYYEDIENEEAAALNHDWDAGVVTTNPTCTNTGVRLLTCNRCGETMEVSEPPLGHDLSTSAVIPPTCTEQGYTERYCSRCDFTSQSDYVAALGHDFSTSSITTQPSCFDAGVRTYYCSRCDATQTESVAAIGSHDWDEGEVTTDPTCTELGVMTYTCNRCGDTRTEPVAALGHTWNEGSVTTAPGCTTTGVRTYTCTVCGATRTEDISATNHDFSVEDPTVGFFRSAATCTAAATYYYKCSRCGASSYNNTNTYFSYGSTIPHTYEDFVTDPTCTVAGYTTHVCSVCGDSYTDTPVAALGHDYSSTSTAPSHLATSANCTDAATYYYSCSRCGANGGSTFSSGDSLGHDWDEGTVTTAATCTTAGSMHFVCTRDASHTKDEEIPALGHDWDAGTQTLAPTCTAVGTMHYVCSRNAEHTKDEDIPALGHDWDEGTVTTQPTCTEPGVRTYTCTRDGSHTYTSPIEATGHDWDSGTVTSPTCTDAGYTTYTCNTCGATYIGNTVAALGHSWNAGVVTDPTCTEDGYTTFTCSRCGATKVESPVDALGHNFTSQVQTEAYHRADADCLNAETYYYKCSRCSESSEGNTNTYYSVGAPLGHIWGPGVITTEPTCTDTGVRTYTCTRDSEHTRTETVNALGHDWDAGTVTTAPTCTETGIRTYTCQNDSNHTYTDVEPALGHNYVAVVTDPTCTEAGYTTYTCSRCGDTYTDDAVAATGHTFVFTRTVAPTCTEDGYDIYTCSVCSATENRNTVTALGHDYDSVVTDPTCTEAGYTTHTCSRCGDSYTDTPVAATGHNYVAVVTPPTCTEAGYTTHTCSVCSDSYTDTPVLALGHDYSAQVQSETYLKSAASCTDPAEYYYKCSRCAASSEGDTDTYYSYGESLGHNYEAVVTAPTCTEAGYTTHTCSRCGDSYTDTPVSALGHTIEGVDWTVVTAATTLEDGLKVKYCSRCGAVVQSEVIPMIVNPTAIDVTPAQNIVNVGSTATLSVTYTPANSNVLELTWTSSDTSIATVNSSGVVTGVAVGAVMITATLVSDGTIYDSASVTVVPNASSSTTDIADSSSDLVVNVGADTTTVTATGTACNSTTDGTNSFDFTVLLSLSETYKNTPIEEGSIVAVVTLDNNYTASSGYRGVVGSTVYPAVGDSVFIPLVEGSNTFTIISPSYIEPDQDGEVLWHVSVYLGGTTKAPMNTLLYNSVVTFENDEPSDATLAVSASDPLVSQSDTTKNIYIGYSNIDSLEVSIEAQDPSTGTYTDVAALQDVSITLAGSGRNYPITIGAGTYDPGTTLRLTFTAYDSSDNVVATDKCYLVVSWLE